MKTSFELNESEKALQTTALDFMQREAPNEIIRALQDSDTGYSEEMWRKAAELGWLGIVIPEKYGGMGSSKISAAALFEALGSGPLPGPYFSSAILSAEIILAAASETQKKEILPDIAQGKKIVALALTEPEYSWTPDGIQMRASSKDGGFVLKGEKLFIIDGKAATHFIIPARTGDGRDPAKGISLFLVDSGRKGVAVRRLPGYLGEGTFELKLDSVRVEPQDVIGKMNNGWASLQQGIEKAIPVLCAYKVGGCQKLVEIALEFSRTRIQFSMPIGRFQRVQDLIMVMVDYTDAARWTTYETLWKMDTGRPLEESIHLAKTVASEAYWETATLAHRVFSGVSYSKRHPVSFHTRASRYLYNFLGEPAYHRQKMGKLLFGV